MPALIVDDEADQASLNTKVRATRRAATYAAIAELRKALPNHLYVQYTATPYAPLLLEPDDHLSPDFVEMLTPARATRAAESSSSITPHASSGPSPQPTSNRPVAFRPSCRTA